MNRVRGGRTALRLCVALLLVSWTAALPTSLLEEQHQTNRGHKAQKERELAPAAPDSSTAAPPVLTKGPGEGKTVAQYEKGYLYGAGKAAQDKHVENALLKSELFGDPSAVNQYRYYGGASERRPDASEAAFAPPNKRSSAFRPMVPHALELGAVGPRLKRELGMDPEDVLTLLQLWQAERHNGNRIPSKWSHYNNINAEEYQTPADNENEDIDEDDPNNGEWLEGPVYPSGLGPHYAVDRRALYYQDTIPQYPYPVFNPYAAYQMQAQKRDNRWSSWGKDKRFMVSKKRETPSTPRGDIHYLAQLLGPAHHEQQVPLYHRMVL